MLQTSNGWVSGPEKSGVGFQFGSQERVFGLKPTLTSRARHKNFMTNVHRSSNIAARPSSGSGSSHGETMTASDALPAVLDHIDRGLDASVERLFALLRIQSISTDPAYAKDCQTAADHVAAELCGLGFEASVRRPAATR